MYHDKTILTEENHIFENIMFLSPCSSKMQLTVHQTS